ncbi:hypothetical protein QJS66_14080 [Kocuria rhizophila]|nr:hypothetical protein QJS66_14080 [Kocuria rhizophila]
MRNAVGCVQGPAGGRAGVPSVIAIRWSPGARSGWRRCADDQAQVLTVQSLRYLYRGPCSCCMREASPSGCGVPGNPVRAGYSIDRLRELTLEQLHVPAAGGRPATPR